MKLPDDTGIFTMTVGEHYETGERIAALTRPCPEDAPPAYRVAWTIRAEANATGRCSSCGAGDDIQPARAAEGQEAR